MSTEIEATFIGIEKDAYRVQLQAVGAELKQKEVLMRKVTFDISEHAFVRVRDEGDKITMSYKHLHKAELSGMEEICLNVNSYDEAIEFLKAIGLKMKAQQETYREEWLLDGCEITIDTWPWIPPYTEIEGPSEEAVKAAAEKLGFEMKDSIYGSVDEVYKRYYHVTNHEVNFRPRILFSDECGWTMRDS